MYRGGWGILALWHYEYILQLSEKFVSSKALYSMGACGIGHAFTETVSYKKGFVWKAGASGTLSRVCIKHPPSLCCTFTPKLGCPERYI